MISLARLASWRLRLRRLCSLSMNTGVARPRSSSPHSPEPPTIMDQPTALMDFVERVDRLVASEFVEANMEFAKLRVTQEEFLLDDEFSMSDGLSMIQNRYRDVVPYNKNRVVLDKPDGDYINASMIQYSGISRQYVAAQAPLNNTVDDFWHMIGQYKIKVVVMLCKVVENSMPKCVQYFPGDNGQKMDLEHGSLETISTESFDDFCIRKIKFTHETFGEIEIHQLHYTEWPDHGCPDEMQHVHRFIEVMDDYQTRFGEDSPLLLHCSAGCGRTGTVVGADIFRKLIRDEKVNSKIDLREFVLELRKQRTSFVQSASQYQLLHKLVQYYCKQALDLAPQLSKKEEVVDGIVPNNINSEEKLEEGEVVSPR